jgi:hypothetical protein
MFVRVIGVVIFLCLMIPLVRPSGDVKLEKERKFVLLLIAFVGLLSILLKILKTARC